MAHIYYLVIRMLFNPINVTVQYWKAKMSDFLKIFNRTNIPSCLLVFFVLGNDIIYLPANSPELNTV